MASISQHQLPSITIKDSEKDEEWHKKFVQAITRNSVNNTYSINYASMNESINFYQGLQNGDQFDFLQEAEDGDSLPAVWINYNKIKVKIDILLGELSQKGYEINVKAMNKDAKVRKLEEKEKMRIEMRLKDVAQNLEETYGLPLQENQNLPESEEELDEYFDRNYKEEAEIVMESAIKFLAKRNNWDHERLALFRDLLIMGRCFVKVEIKEGMPHVRRVDPRLMVFDTNATDDFLSDSAYFGEVRYMNMGDAAETYNLTRKELEEAYKAYQEYNQNIVGQTGQVNDFGAIGDSDQMKFFKAEAGELRVMVVTACWIDTKSYNHKVSDDKYGNTHIKKVDDDNESSKVEKKRVKIWRQGTLIGGKFLKDWGEVKNQPRDIDSLAETNPPYLGIIPNYLNGAGISKVHQLKGLQNLKDIAMYNVQLAMARAGAKGFVYDISQVPDTWDVNTVIKYLKTVGIAFIDSKKDGLPSQFNQFQQIDMTLSESVERYISISRMVDTEMDEISGVNEARQGIVQNASQAVGVTQSALMQSNLATAQYFNMFERFVSDALNIQARLVKIAWANKEKFAPIIGDTGVDFISNDIDLDLNDYGVFVESVPPMLDDLQKFQEIVMAALQSGSLDFVDAIKLLKEKDVTLGIRRLEKDINRKKKEEYEREQSLAQQQQQAAQAQLEATKQYDAYKANLDKDTKLTVQALKNDGDIEKELIKTKNSLTEKHIDIKAKLAELRQKESEKRMKQNQSQ